MKVTPQEVQDSVREVLYHRFPGTQVTVCCIVMDNKFTAIGTSACVDPVEFDEAIGKSIAYKRAEDDVWKMLGFRMSERLAKEVEG